MRIRIAIAVCLVAAGQAAAAAPCATREELEALQMRHLQSRFVVAALSCGQQDAYNAFVTRFQPDLAANGGRLAGYFSRNPGGASALNQAVTEMANAASQLRAQDPVGFCTATWNLFWLLNQEPARLSAAAADSLMYAVPLPAQCQSPPVVSADRGQPPVAAAPARPVPVR